jgi:hypothetical protein
VSVKDLMVGSDLMFADRGSHQLKGVPGAWSLYAARKESKTDVAEHLLA